MRTITEAFDSAIARLTTPRKSVKSNAVDSQEHSIEDRIWLIQIQYIFKQYVLVGVGALPSAMLLAYLFKDMVNANVLWGWLAAVFILNTLYVVVLVVAFRREWPWPQGHKGWQRIVSLNGVLSGALWGSVAWLFFTPGQMDSQLIILLWIWITPFVVMTYKHGYLYFVVTLLLLTAVRFAIEGSPTHLLLSGTSLFYLGILFYFTNNNHNVLVDSIRLRLENEQLVSELEEKRELAENANVAKSRFLASASHDLRQPLHAQGLFIAELEECVKESHAKKVLSHLVSATKMMGRLFDSLLNISSLDAGAVEPKIRDFNVNHTIQALAQEFDSQAKEKSIQLRSVPCNLVVRSDPVLLSRIIRNYLANAIRYTERGHILLGCRRRGDQLCIKVCDTGIGIPQDKQKEIFLEFHQLGNDERDQQKGLGLGLAIVSRIAKLLAHKIEVQSTLGRGTCFSVTVPIVETSALPETSMEKLLLERHQHQLQGKIIIVIDDEQSVRKGMRLSLERWGCHVIDAESAQEILILLENSGHKPDMIISDYRLRHDTNGVQAITKIKEFLHQEIPALLITGDTTPQRLREIRESGYRLLHKPVHPPKLRLLLETWLGGQQ